MDTSIEYIEMCQKAEEIQVMRIKQGDYIDGDCVSFDGVCCSHIGSTGIVINEKYILEVEKEDVGEFNEYKPHPIWLPRQDQLQEIFFEDEGISSVYSFMTQLYGDFCNKFTKFDSMEKLIISFVMLKVYNKKWCGDNWMIIS